VLQRLHDEVPADHFTLAWLTNNLHKRSFGIIMLLIALVRDRTGALDHSWPAAYDSSCPDDRG
jgi:hypothetical protein